MSWCNKSPPPARPCSGCAVIVRRTREQSPPGMQPVSASTTPGCLPPSERPKEEPALNRPDGRCSTGSSQIVTETRPHRRLWTASQGQAHRTVRSVPLSLINGSKQRPRRSAANARRVKRGLSPSVTDTRAWCRQGRVSGRPIPAHRSRHGERRRVIMNIAQRLRSAHPVARYPSRMTFVSWTSDMSYFWGVPEGLCWSGGGCGSPPDFMGCGWRAGRG
jgi:hypothetical protein